MALTSALLSPLPSQRCSCLCFCPFHPHRTLFQSSSRSFCQGSTSLLETLLAPPLSQGLTPKFPSCMLGCRSAAQAFRRLLHPLPTIGAKSCSTLGRQPGLPWVTSQGASPCRGDFWLFSLGCSMSDVLGVLA